jgi:hypothetical protein
MRANLKATRALGWLCAALMVFGTTYAQGLAKNADLKLQCQLLWGTDDVKPPEGKNYKPVAPDILNRLKELPLKWKNYFEVKRTDFTIGPELTKKVPLSDKCELNVVRQNNSTVEVSLIGRGKEVVRRTQSLPRGQILVLGGNAPNATAWLVILKRTD